MPSKKVKTTDIEPLAIPVRRQLQRASIALTEEPAADHPTIPSAGMRVIQPRAEFSLDADAAADAPEPVAETTAAPVADRTPTLPAAKKVIEPLKPIKVAEPVKKVKRTPQAVPVEEAVVEAESEAVEPEAAVPAPAPHGHRKPVPGSAAPTLENDDERARQIQHYIDTRRFYVPINAVAIKRSIKVSWLLTFLVFLLAVVLIDLMLDSGLIVLLQKVPHTHFFNLESY